MGQNTFTSPQDKSRQEKKKLNQVEEPRALNVLAARFVVISNRVCLKCAVCIYTHRREVEIPVPVMVRWCTDVAHVASAEATGGFPLEPGVYRSSPGISVYEGFPFFFFGLCWRNGKSFHTTQTRCCCGHLVVQKLLWKLVGKWFKLWSKWFSSLVR